MVNGERFRRIPAAFDEEKGYLFWARKGASRAFFDIPYPKEMTMIERGQVSTLAKNIWSNTNMIGYRGNGGINAYSEEEIGILIGLKPSYVKKFIRKMIQLEMMAKVIVKVGETTETHFYISPLYFCSTDRISLNLYLIFKDQFDRVLPEWVKTRYAEVERHNLEPK